MYLNGIDECECDVSAIINPADAPQSQQFMKQLEVEDKSQALYDFSTVANVVSIIGNILRW